MSQFEYADGRIRHLTHLDAKRIVRIARAVARADGGRVDPKTVELARVVTCNLDERLLRQRADRKSAGR